MKIKREFETLYDKGDIVIFKKFKTLEVGRIVGFYEEDNCIWYNVAINKDYIYTYTTGGDIPEFDIIVKIRDEELKMILQKAIEEDD